MDAFISRKRRRISPSPEADFDFVTDWQPTTQFNTEDREPREEETTDVKLAILSSLRPDRSPEDLLEILLGCEGSVEDALQTLAVSTSSTTEIENASTSPTAKRGRLATPGLQSALPFTAAEKKRLGSARAPILTKKGKTLHLYTPEDIAQHTPCSVIHNFLPTDLANALLEELLAEVPSYESIRFKLFDNVVKSPHTACFYVESLAELQRQRSEYYYNGNDLGDIRQILPVMRQVSDLVRDAVNTEIAIRIRDFNPGANKLQYQSSKPWQPNAAFVNCYDGGAQHVGYHSDQLSYLGPRAVIGSLSLGVAREFRVRKIVPKDDDGGKTSIPEPSGRQSAAVSSSADLSGQIAIHPPHNSLLVMHAEMQEEWKHSIAPAQTITPHPIADNKRINITYRWYREEFRPKNTPKCRCGVPCVLKTVQKQKATRGRYMWMCQMGNRPEGGEGCGWFEWARFNDDGAPIGWNRNHDHDHRRNTGAVDCVAASLRDGDAASGGGGDTARGNGDNGQYQCAA
ncbi:hypothetical protein A1O1_04669 [Capronia coronata CBS 617.96]|uniref:Uncharacterized protein n=1 Tax=Capronia coronata CBS 617.96 TaxID=1182541 RepID=W9Y5D5_9EURO|nr:uncharacterized protein A1O1_04669 [Capronia coronata CBS 617.96]EXJ87743.1 hypothetical protein A1O1_04669 [Capronia coronata CBS 617.96]